jgi:uncharacterized membrane protein
MAKGRFQAFAADDEARVVAAITGAEQGNRGEVRVHVEERCRGDALARARAVFAELGMARTQESTGVLLYLAPNERKAAVFAGAGIHGAAGEGFWREVIDAVAKGYAGGTPVDGLEAALERIGAILREHAPGEDRAGNELPDAVTTSTEEAS